MSSIHDYIEKIRDRLEGPEKDVLVKDVKLGAEYMGTVSYSAPYGPAVSVKRVMRDIYVWLDIGGKIEAIKTREIFKDTSRYNTLSKEEIYALQILQSEELPIKIRVKETSSNQILKKLAKVGNLANLMDLDNYAEIIRE